MRTITKISLIFIMLILPVLSSAVPAHNHQAPSNNKETTCHHCCESVTDSACADGGQCQCDITQASYSMRSPATNIAIISPHSVYKHGLPSHIASLVQDSLYRPPISTL